MRSRTYSAGRRRLSKDRAGGAETAADARDVIVEGPSGLLAVHPADYRPKFEQSKRRLT
jgi:phage terminase large subunit-like protein